jgi:serine/threonine protein kinase
MLCSKGNNSEWVEVVDFGISKLKNEQNQTTFNITRLGDVCGSPPYMSPEQCLSAVPVDSRSDIYALGVVLYESLSGQLPFKAKTAVEMLDCHLYMPPSPIKVANPSLSMCDSLNRFFLKALEKDPDKRFQCMKEFAQELNDAILRDASKVRKEVKSDTESFKNFLSDVKTAQVTIKDSDTNQSIAHLKQVLKEDTDEEKEADTTVLEGLAKTIITTIFGPRDSEVKDKAEEYVLLECPYCLSSIEPAFKFCLSCGRNLISPQKLTALRVSGKVFAYPTDIAKSGGNNTMSSVRKDEINAIRAMLVSVLVIIIVCFCLMIPQVREIVMQLVNSTN